MEKQVIISLEEFEGMREGTRLLEALSKSINVKNIHTPEHGYEPIKIVSVRKRDLLNFFEKLNGDDTYYDIEIIG